MDDDKKDISKEENVVTPEEQKAEEEATKEVNEDELRDKLADDLGVDPDDDDQKELLDKLVQREKSHREKLSGAIKQKISWREKAKVTSEKPKVNPEEGKDPNQGTPDLDKLVDQKLSERLEAQALETLDLTDELKAEVKDLAKLKGISIREAAQHPYILNRKEEAEKEKRMEDATPKRSNKGSYAPSYDPSKPLNPENFDFNTKEGVQAWNDAKVAKRKYEAQKNK